MSLLSGTWFVVVTTLPLWRSRQNPSITYVPLPDGRVTDLVTYTRRGRVKVIAGVDVRQPDGSYRWRGLSPLTRLATSRWSVVESEGEWAITRFARTPFTPAGWDVYARDPDADVSVARRRLAELAPDSRSSTPCTARRRNPARRPDPAPPEHRIGSDSVSRRT